MPCDSIQVSESVPFDKVNFPRLQKALLADGWRVGLQNGVLDATRFVGGSIQRFVLRQGEVQATIAVNASYDDPDNVAASIRRSYAAATVKELSARYGWKLTNEKSGQNTKNLQFRR